MVRPGSLIVGVAAGAALSAALLLVLRLGGVRLQGVASALMRLIRGQEDHPHWELLMQ